VELVRVAEVSEISVARKVIADKLTRSHLTAAHVTITTSVDMTEAISLRERLAPEIENKIGTKPSYTDIIVKITSYALKKYPILNSTLEGNKIKLLADVNIGVAVALEDSLIVPVVPSADQKSLAEIATYLNDKIEKARKGQLSVDEVTGGTFTVSNLGVFDVEVFTPIINPPECAILGVGKILPKPWVVDDQVTIRPIATLSLSFDHRIIDGAKAAAFLQEVKQNLQRPQLVLS
jgi:pyruvate dehydrogenase E2 component (dihydrolipoamide acetyltransferase)